MTNKKLLSVLLFFVMIIFNTLPVLADNHNALNGQSILVLSAASGGGGSSSSGGGGGGYNVRSSGGGGGGSDSISYDSRSDSASSGGGGGYNVRSASGGGGGGDGSDDYSYDSRSDTAIIEGGSGGYNTYSSASGGGDGSEDTEWTEEDEKYNPLEWDSIYDYFAYREGLNNSSNNNNASNGLVGWVKNANDNKWNYYEYDKSTNDTKKATGWKHIKDSWYFFGEDGTLYENTMTPDGYYVDANGVWKK